MSNLIPPIVVGLGVAVSAFPIVAVAGPLPAPPAARAAQDDGMPAVPTPAEGSAEAPPLSAATPVEGEAAAPSRTVLLMKDGNVRIFDAPVAEGRTDYLVSMGIGEFPVPKAQVEARFGTLREAYEYQRDHLPDRDPDEHLRLARWCVSHDMEDEAAEQLRALLSWSPGDRTAEGMLRSLTASAASRAARDAAVVRTGGELAGGGTGAEPRELHASVLGQIRAYRGPVSAPPIFDLPEPLAVRRFREFGESVHRVLQARCASCHDELSDRNFRLVRARDPKDLANALLARTNLEATLALVDQVNPGHSPLLINAVMPHGPDQRPILTNPNSAEYRALWNWIESLRGDSAQAAPAAIAAPVPAPIAAPAPGMMPQGVGLAAPAPMPADPGFGGGFASQRTGPIGPAPAPAPMPMPMPAGAAMSPYPHATHQQMELNAVHPGAPAELDFQTVSPLLGSPDAARLSVDGRAVLPPGSAMAPSQSLNWPNAAPAPAGAPAPGALPPQVVPTPGGLPPQATPGAAPPPGAVAPQGRVVAPAPAPVPSPAAGQPGVVAQPDGPQIIAQPDGSKLMRLPDGELVPYMDKTAIDEQTGPGKEFQIDPALLEKLQRRRMGTP